MVRLKQVLKFLLFLSLGLLILYLIYNNQQSAYLEECAKKGIAESDCSLLEKVILDLKTAKWGYIFISVLVYMVSCVIRAIRWNMLTEPIGFPIKKINAFGAVMVGYLANMALPRVGEFVRAGVISKYEKISTEKAFGTILTERVVDVIMLLGVVVVSVALEYDKIVDYFIENSNFKETLIGLLSMRILSILLIFILSAYFIIKRYKDRLLDNPFVSKIKKIWVGLKSGMMSIMALKRPYLFILYSILIWVCYYFMTFIAFKSFVPTENLGMQSALIVFLFGSLGVAFPSPGGMGSYHFLVMQILLLYGVDLADGFSFANIIFFSVNIGGNVLVGLLSLLLLPIINRKNEPQTQNIP